MTGVSDGGNPAVPPPPTPADTPTAGPSASDATVADLASTIVDATTPDSGPDNRPADGAVLRYGTVTGIGTAGNAGKVQTSTTGAAWVTYDVSYGAQVGDLVYLLQQGPVVHVGGQLGGTQPTPPPVGVMHPFAGSVAPAGWLLANGQAVSRTTYAALYAVCGIAYGAGDGATTFNVPDARDRVLAAAGTALFARGEKAGAEFTTLSVAQLPSHVHGQAAHNHTSAAHVHGQAAHNHSVATHSHDLGSHSHSMNHGHSTAAHSHDVSLHSGSVLGVTGGTGTYAYVNSATTPTSSETVTVNSFTGSTSATDPGTTASGGPSSTGSTDAGNTDSTTPGSTGSTDAGNTDATGSGTSFNNMPPYLTIGAYLIRALP